MVKECEMDKTIFECESVDGRDSLLVERHAGWIVLNGIWAPVYISNESAESLALALLDDLGKGWKPTDKFSPDKSDTYLVTVIDVQTQETWLDLWGYDHLRGWNVSDEAKGYEAEFEAVVCVIAYFEVDPYQPKEL